MRILISGASGFIGSATSRFLKGQGYQVMHLVRREPNPDEVRWDPDREVIDAEGLEGFDAVVHLASVPWPSRWTAQAKQMVRANRLAANGLLARSLAACKQKPQVLVCASGQGIYPSSGDEILTEASSTGGDFLARLQCDGEAITAQASAAGIRVVHLRIPMVVGVPNIRGGISRAGSGRQWTSWVGRDELANIIHYVLVTDALVGPINPVSPNPLHQAEFMATVNRLLGTRGFPLPALLVRLMMGEMGEELMLASRRLAPQRLLDSGYHFRFPELEEALRHELGAGPKTDNN